MNTAAFKNDRERAVPSRALIVRDGIGAAGRVIQHARLTSHRITAEMATLIVVENGTKTARWSGGIHAAQPGNAIALFAGETLDLTNSPDGEGNYCAHWISWAPSLTRTVGLADATQAPVRLLPHLSEGFYNAYRAAFDSLSAVETVPAPIAEHRLREVLLWLRECGVIFPSKEDTRMTSRLRKLIAEKPAGNWSLEEVARRLHSTTPTVRRKLASEETSYRNLLADVRMSHALTLLQNTDLAILEVAGAVGYDSPSRFTTRFRLRFGYLPSDIRGGHKQGLRQRAQNEAV